MNSVLLTGGRVVDPANQIDTRADVYIKNGKIEAVGADLIAQVTKDVEVISVSDKVVCPGLIDIHVHLREPGQRGKEGIATGTAAAAKGGFTSVLCMPNTVPVVDSASVVALINERASHDAKVNVYVAGAISKGSAGEELASLGSLKQAGIVAVTDDGRCVQNNELMRRAMEYARMLDLPILDHCQDYSLVTEGVMHEGLTSTKLGLRGWPAVGEDNIVSRNIMLAELTGARIHCQHISSAGAVRQIREAKKRGISVTAETCPHYFTLTDKALAGSADFWSEDGKDLLELMPIKDAPPQWPIYDTRLKMNPPVRSQKDRKAIQEAVIDGTIDIICSDHAPHCNFEKEVEFDYAPFGITGLETELALSLMAFYHAGKLPLSRLIAKFTVEPAKLLKISKGTLSKGADADIAVIDLNDNWIFTPESTASKSFNSPFYGWSFKGRTVMTWVNGIKVFDASSL
jgi:dihydroorotase